MPMTEPLRIKGRYTLAKCCNPQPPNDIIGYFSYNGILKVHAPDCPNLIKAEPDRLVSLTWENVLEETEEFKPDPDYDPLEPIDFAILAHHEHYGYDYSHVVARKLNIPKQEAFDRHYKLRDIGLLERVEPTMIQYRKGIVDNKWIKHRNHTYYDLTDKGRAYLNHYSKQD